MDKERPIELWTVIILIIMVVILNIVLLRYHLLHPDTPFQTAAIESLLWVIMGIIVIYFLYKGHLWAWNITVIAICIVLIMGIYNFIFVTFIRNIFGLFLTFISLYLMFRPNVREYFNKEKKK
jgi:hypothetical protein